MRPPNGKTDGIRVLVVDDNDLVRQLVVARIREQADMTLVGEASTGQAGVAAVQRLRPDVVVMDGSMPAMGGVEATRRILALLPDVRVVAFAGSPATAQELMVAGAVVMVEKTASLNQLLNAIRRACAVVA